MNRAVWFAAGTGVGVYAVVRARRLAEALTPDGARDRLAGLRLGARLMAEEFTAGAAERDAELRDRLGLVPHGVPELAAGATPRATGAGVPGTIAAPEHPDRHSHPRSPGAGDRATEEGTS
ncbi:hypothetical protein QE364_003438 [Nocardioides zeae]|uniref:Uncharacterized protein n=2 Tax=Nocardioides zeae TaxID=1457234 RepID=A0AAJ1X0X4_9ACTN|nr:DUF6167 family protein [Nocardioides zeae]MDQ1104316.1 hypothetical protein [Nocardioides zeae]MDR6175993.1 hypothetical protein [Nocardioides zeae]MDR6211710.1 hypothetical protein [Nocardioides zeae]